MKQKMFKKRNTFWAGVLAFAMSGAYFLAPNTILNKTNVAEAANSWSYKNGQSGTFVPAQTGKYMITVRGTNGSSGGAGYYYYYPSGMNYSGTYYPGNAGGSGGVGYSKQGYATLSKGTNYSYQAGGNNGGASSASYTGYLYNTYFGYTNSTSYSANSCWGDVSQFAMYLLYPGSGGVGGRAAYISGIGLAFGASGGGGGSGGTEGYMYNYSGYAGGAANASVGGSGGSSSGNFGNYTYHYSGCSSATFTTYTGSGGSGQSYSATTGMASVSNLGNVFSNGEVTIQLYTPTATPSSPATSLKTSKKSVTLSWTGATNYGGTITEYQVRAGTTAGGTDVLAVTSTGTTTSRTITIPDGYTTAKTIYWQVRAYNANGGWSEWSDGQSSFTFQPPITTLSSPATGTSFQSNSIDVSWGSPTLAPDASLSRYDIRAGTTSGGTNILAETSKGTSTLHTLVVPAGTAGNTTIYWQVRAVDSNGYVGPWSAARTVVYANNVPTITGTGNTPAKLDVSLEKRNHGFSVNSLKDSDDFNYVTLFADVLDSGGNVVSGSKKQIVLDKTLVNSTSVITGTSTEKDGSLQGPFDYKTAFNLKIALQPDFTTGKFDLTLTKSDGTTNVIKSGQKLLTGRTMQATGATAPENYSLRIYPEDRQNANALSTSALASVPTVTPFTIAFTADTRNYLPRLTNVKHDVAKRVFSDAEGFNRISVTGHVDDSDPADKVTMYYEVQPKAASYAIQVKTENGKTVPKNGKAIKTYDPKVDNDFAFTYQVDTNLESGNYDLIVYGYDSQGGIGDYNAISFTVDRAGPTIDFVADYTVSGKTIKMSSAQKQVVAEDNKVKLYFTPNNYATFEYAGYLVRSGTVSDLRIRGAFTNEVKATFVGVNLGQDPITLMNGTKTDFKLNDVLVFKFKATSATGIVTKKDVRILIGDDASTFTPLDDAKIPTLP